MTTSHASTGARRVAAVLAHALLLAACSAGSASPRPAPATPAVTATAAAPPTSEPPQVEALEEPVFDVEALVSGGLQAQASWRDSSGDNLLALSGDNDPVSADPADGIARALLSAQHYRATSGAEPALLAERSTETAACGGDIVDRFYPETVQVTDLDADGLGEASVVRATGCVTDVTATVSALLFTDGQVYEVGGPRNLVGEVGDAAPEPVGEPAPEAFADHLVSLWSSTLSSSTEGPDPADLTLRVSDVDGAAPANLVETEGDEFSCYEPYFGPLTRGEDIELPDGAGFAATAVAIPEDQAAADEAFAGSEATARCEQEQVEASLRGRVVLSDLAVSNLDLAPPLPEVRVAGGAYDWTGSSQGAEVGGTVELLNLRFADRVEVLRYSYTSDVPDDVAGRWREELLARAAERLSGS